MPRKDRLCFMVTPHNLSGLTQQICISCLVSRESTGGSTPCHLCRIYTGRAAITWNMAAPCGTGREHSGVSHSSNSSLCPKVTLSFPLTIHWQGLVMGSILSSTLMSGFSSGDCETSFCCSVIQFGGLCFDSLCGYLKKETLV